VCPVTQTGSRVRVFRQADNVMVYDSGMVANTNNYFIVNNANVLQGVGYYWQMMTRDSVNNTSDYTATTTGDTRFTTLSYCPVGNPTIQAVFQLDFEKINVAWNDVVHESGYLVQRSNASPLAWSNFCSTGSDITNCLGVLAPNTNHVFSCKS
jgi:hypothetical protein